MLLLLFLELLRGQIAKARMRPVVVVVLPPSFDDDTRFDPVPEPLHAQTLVAELAVEAFGGAVLPRLARLDVVNRPGFLGGSEP